MKTSGCDFAYIHCGKFVGFVRVWTVNSIVRAYTTAIVSLAFSKYVTKPFFPECDPPDDAVQILAAGCICKNEF